MVTNLSPLKRQASPSGLRQNADAVSVLVGEYLADAVKRAPAGRRIGVRLAALGGHLLLRLDEPTDPGSAPRPEALYARVSVPAQDPSSPRDDLVGTIERGLGELCGVEAALVHRDGDRALAVLITRSNRPGGF
jgi:hypothetical protein